MQWNVSRYAKLMEEACIDVMFSPGYNAADEVACRVNYGPTFTCVI